jgi:hypothetical protein
MSAKALCARDLVSRVVDKVRHQLLGQRLAQLLLAITGFLLSPSSLPLPKASQRHECPPHRGL